VVPRFNPEEAASLVHQARGFFVVGENDNGPPEASRDASGGPLSFVALAAAISSLRHNAPQPQRDAAA
jgi:hypothetical protein